MRTLRDILIASVVLYLVVGLVVAVETVMTREIPPGTLLKPEGFLSWFLFPVILWATGVGARVGVSELVFLGAIVGLATILVLTRRRIVPSPV